MNIKKGYIEYNIKSIALEIRTGKTPPSSEDVYYNNGTVNWFTPGDIGGISILTNSAKKITNAAIDNKTAILHKPNSVLITCIGEIGRVGIISAPASSNQQITGVLVNEKIILHKFFYYWLLRNQDLLRHYSNYAVIPILNNSILENIPIFVPDLETQRKFVAQLDLMQLLIDGRSKSISLIDEVAKSSFLEMFGDPINIPNGSPAVTLEKLGKWQSGGTPSRLFPQYFEGNIPWYSSGELNEIFISNSRERITTEALLNSSAKKIEKGSLLLGMYDTAALKGSITEGEASCNQAIAFAKLDETICSTLYVYYAIQLSKKRYLDQRLGARQQNLNLQAIKKLVIPFPDLEEQKKFENKILTILNHKSKLQKSLAILETFFSSLLQDVFDEKEFIQEKDMFSELVGTFTKADYLHDKRRISYLISALNNHEFKDYTSYQIGRSIAFEFLNENKIIQVFNKDKQRNELQAATL